jgi:hypothetical protein
MTTLQQYLNQKYPTKEDKEAVKEIDSRDIFKGISKNNLENFVLDLSKFSSIEKIFTENLLLTELNINGLINLQELHVGNNNLTSVDFLNHLPNPEKLKSLTIYNNKIQPTDISVFSRFVNLKTLKIGTEFYSFRERKHNKFYGSLESYKNLTKLESICIEATDVDRGLEWLPESLAKSAAKEAEKGKFYIFNNIQSPLPTNVAEVINKESWGRYVAYHNIECSPHGTDAKCKAIQDELRPFNYDVEAWQLAHPELMAKVWKEKYKDKEILITRIKNKIKESEEELEKIRTSEEKKDKKIARLEEKIRRLIEVGDQLEKGIQTEITTADKSTQTEVTKETVMELLQKLEVK